MAGLGGEGAALDECITSAFSCGPGFQSGSDRILPYTLNSIMKYCDCSSLVITSGKQTSKVIKTDY